MDERVSDAAVDRELESLLAVEPSPEFVARVRARVAQEPEPGRGRASWGLAAAVAVASVLVAIIAWPSREATPSDRTQVEPPRIAEAAPTIAPPRPAPLPERGRRTAVRAVATVERDRRDDIDLPEVVIADNEVKTFASLVASIRQSQFDVAVPVAPDPDTPIEIKELPPAEALEIEPIVRVAALETEGERP